MRLSYAQERLLSVIDAPDTLDGSLLAVRKLDQWIKHAARIYPTTNAQCWIDPCDSLLEEIKRFAKHQPRLSAVSGSIRPSATYRILVDPIRSSISREATAQVEAAMGLIIVAAAGVARVLPTAALGAYRTLHASGGSRRSSTSDEWRSLLEQMPLSLESADALAKRSGVSGIIGFAATVASALRTPVLRPEALDHPNRETSRDERMDHQDQVRNSILEDADGPSGIESAGAPGANGSAQRRSLVGLRRAHSQHAEYRARFGVAGRWERQTPHELVTVCRAVRRALSAGPPERGFAYLAVIGLATSLSAKHCSEVQITTNSDLWLDVHRGVVNWNLLQVLDWKKVAAHSRDAVEARHNVEIWLPAVAVHAGEEMLFARPGSRDLFELITGENSPAEREVFIERYRAWLRGLGEGCLHGTQDARFSTSRAQFLRDQAGDVVAALLGLDFDEVAMGTLHYVCVERSFLHQNADLAWQRIGLGPVMKIDGPDRLVGSAVALQPDEFAKALDQCVTETNAAAAEMRLARTPQELVDSWHQLVHLRLLLIMTLTAGRGARIERLTWAAVYGHPDYILLRDKDSVEYAATRLVPIVAQVRALLDQHARDLGVLDKRAQDIGLRTADPAGRCFDHRRPRAQCFYAARVDESEGPACLRRTAIDRTHLSRLAQRLFGRELNVGRHTLVSMSVRNGVDPTLIKVLTGHARGTAEPFSDGQWVSPRDALALLASALKWMLDPPLPTLQPSGNAEILKLDEWSIRLPLRVRSE